eukprot:TRINITY_DN15197_c0_g1_i1.p1 TRINITY_DN15197_c0_g1~~TRINITY_DN15197_c0_g1_i1.p1  ORF type:complete len:114 (+),score=27.60 TRINITY_DN15197_c0_g1_i1:2-343(+)
MGFGGSAPCAQRNGEQKFITKHPKQYLMDAINDESAKPKKSIFGANKHEGSFVLGMIYNSYILPNGVVEDTHFLRHCSVLLFSRHLVSRMTAVSSTTSSTTDTLRIPCLVTGT